MGQVVVQPAWKRWLSYLFEIHIESAPSKINPHLYVCLSRGRYQLGTKNAVYSYGDLYNNYHTAFSRLNWQSLPERCRVLLLGVGLGSIPYMLENNFGKTFSYTGVEIDDHVLYLANKYVLSGLRSPMVVHQADAFRFMQLNNEQFDVICMDVFLDDDVPQQFESPEFLDMLRRGLSAQGVLLYNCLAQTDRDVVQTQTFLHDHFLKAFPEGGYLDVRGNWMLLNDSALVQ